MKYIYKGIDLLVSGMGWIAAICATSMVLLIGVDIIGRRFFNNPTGVSEEVSAYLLIAVTFLGVSYTFAKKGHLAVNVLLDRLPDLGVKIMSILNGIIAFGVCAMATYYSLQLPLASIRMGSKTSTMLRAPLVYPQMLVPIGMGILTLAIIAQTIKIFGVPSTSIRNFISANPLEQSDL